MEKLLRYQKLNRYISPIFLSNSFAYQDNKGVLDAVMKAKEYLSEGYVYVAEIDLKDYFDTIPHDKMMNLIKERIEDDKVINLIYKYMHCNIATDEGVRIKCKGLIQGNPISTILSNLYLHSLDKFMEEKEYKWIRFADNICIYCKNDEECTDVYNIVIGYIKDNLKLFINNKKSGVYKALERPLLGYEFYKIRKIIH